MGGKERLYICACEASVFSCRIMTIMRIQKKSYKRPPQQFLLNMHDVLPWYNPQWDRVLVV